MKKIFFLAALVISAMSYAQSSVNWYDVATVDNNGIKNGANLIGAANYETVQLNSDGDIFVTAAISSVGRDPHALIFNQTLEAVPAKVNAANTNPAPMFVKLNAAGEVQWTVAATDANYKSYASLPLSDGGMLVALVGHQANPNALGLLKYRSADAAGKYYALGKVQYGLLVKIAADGTPTVLDTITQAVEGKTDGIQFRKIVTDGTNYYVLANIKSAVNIGSTTITPAHTGGCLGILKFNAAGKYQGAIQTGGQFAITTTTAELLCENNKLYLVCGVKGTAGAPLTLGELNTTYPDSNTDIAVFIVNTNLTGDAVKFIPGVVAGGKNTITTYGVQIVNNKLFVSGKYQGGLVAAGVADNTTGKDRAFVATLDLANDAATAICLPAANDGQISTTMADDLLVHGDSLYAVYYDNGGADGNIIFLQAMDQNLALGSCLPLAKGTALKLTPRGAAIHGNNLIYTAYEMKDFTCTLVADPTINFTPALNSSIIVSQQVFNSATGINEVRADGKGARKVVNEGKVYVISGTGVYDVNGMKIED
ncbi:MAG: hypothetical protein J6T85_01050 [Paludibacteraceae bacterium]|nr:hypothetical protein [Paludibacteraceae bacterium]